MRHAPLLICLLGAVLLLYTVGEYCGASLPYPDPTAELLARQRQQLEAAEQMAMLGAIVFGIGWIWLAVRRNWRPPI